MDGKALYVLAGYDEITQARLSGMQDRLYERGFSGVQTKNIPMHITLGSFPVSMEAGLCDTLRKVSQNTEPFAVTFNHVGIFGGAKVLFAAPDHNERLLALKEEFGSSYDWTAHTTLLIDEPDVIFGALPVVMEDFSAFSGNIASLHLYEFFPARHIMSADLRQLHV